MKKLIHIGLLLCIAATVAAQENRKLLKTYDWKDLPQQFPNSQIISMDGMLVLKIENTNNTPLEILLLRITNSSLIAKAGLIQLEIKYENVQRRFETNSFSRITYESRLMFFRALPAVILGGNTSTNSTWFDLAGTENWSRHDFSPKESDEQPNPTELTLKLSFESTGTIYLRPIKLLGKYKSSNWRSPKQAGRIGGIGGAIIGCLGGLIGLLASKGKARNFVLATIKIFIALGIILLIAGVVAIALQQPYDVWYSLLLPGFILTLVFSLNLPSIQRRYDELEIRRMTSIDTMRS